MFLGLIFPALSRILTFSLNNIKHYNIYNMSVLFKALQQASS